jgi:very-short-patch-repair endonuclease
MPNANARKLRREATEAERGLWPALRDRRLSGYFRRQYPIGPFIVDFARTKERVIVEADGGQHPDAKPMAVGQLGSRTKDGE